MCGNDKSFYEYFLKLQFFYCIAKRADIRCRTTLEITAAELHIRPLSQLPLRQERTSEQGAFVKAGGRRTAALFLPTDYSNISGIGKWEFGKEGGRACRIRRTQNHHKPYNFDPSFANNIFPSLSIPTFINDNEFLVLENVWLAPKGLREARREEVLLRHSNLIDLYRCSSSSSRPQPILNDEGDGKGVDFKMLVISWVNFVFIN